MNREDWSARIRVVLSNQFILVLVFALVLTGLFGFWAYNVNVVPEYEQEQQVVEQWEETTAFEHGSVATNESSLWSAGEELTDRPIYYTSVSTDLEGTYTYEYTAASGSVSATTDTYLLVRTLEDGADDAVFWEVSEPLEGSSEESIEPDDEHNVSFTVDIESVQAEIEEIEAQLDANVGTVDVRVVAATEVDGEIEGEPVSATYRSEMPIEADGSTFSVGDVETVDEQERTTEQTQTLVEPSTSESIGSIVAFVLGLTAVIGLVVGRHTESLEIDDEQRQRLRYNRNRQRFDEWITTGSFPSEREYESTILVDDLTGLIDVAIDTNKRVIEDQQLGVSTVLDEEYIYIYVHPGSPARDWLLNYADETMSEFDGHDF